MRAGATVFIILGVPAMIALPALGHAQGPTVSRGLLRGTLSSPDAATGLLRGSMPQGTGGLTRGSLPSGGTSGLLQATPPGAKVGLLLDTTRNATVPVLPAGMSPAPYALVRGSVSSVPGALLASPVPADARFGEPGPRDLAGTLESQSQLYLVDGIYPQGEAMLNGSVAIRERLAGGDAPEVAANLERDAQVMRHYDRQAAAADMDVRAKEMRKRLEPAPAPKKPERF